MIATPQKNRLADLLYGRQNTSIDEIAPKNFYIGLSTQSMGADGVISGEPNAEAGYARYEIANNKNNFEVAVDGTVYNKGQVTWSEATEAWGLIRTVFFAASKDATEALYYVNVSKDVPANCTLYFKEGDLAFSISN